MVKTRYLIEVESETNKDFYLSEYLKHLEKTFSYGNRDFQLKVISEEKDLLTEKEHERVLRQLLIEKESELYKKFISVVDKFCYSEDDVKKMDKLLRQVFNEE